MTAPVDPHTTATRARIWATLVLASMEARLPAPKQLRFGDQLPTPLVTLEFDTRPQAALWANWLRTDVVRPDMCMYAGTRLDWDWHLLWLKRPVTEPEAASALDERSSARVVGLVYCRHCGSLLEPMAAGWVDNAGWFSCAKDRAHEPPAADRVRAIVAERECARAAGGAS